MSQVSGAVTPPKILILGDSLSAAYNIPRSASWPQIFLDNIGARFPKASVNNASISGETTFGGLQRLDDLIERFEPTILIIELGGNDGLRGLNFSETEHNLESMVKQGLQNNIDVLLIGVDLPPNLGPAYNRRFQQIFESIADQYPIHYLPHFLDGVAAAEPHLMQSDGIHPTAAAQPILAGKVLNAVLRMLEE